jgi:hypothetical protein
MPLSSYAPFVVPEYVDAKTIRDLGDQVVTTIRKTVDLSQVPQGPFGGRILGDHTIEVILKTSMNYPGLVQTLPMNQIVGLHDAGQAMIDTGTLVRNTGSTMILLGQSFRARVNQGAVLYLDAVKVQADQEAQPGATSFVATQAYNPIKLALDKETSRLQNHNNQVERAQKEGQGDLQKVLEDNQRLRLAVEALSEENRRLRQQSPSGGAPDSGTISSGRRHLR